MGTRNEEGRRFRNARSDATVGSIEERIEKDYGLPEGSVSIRNPGGGDARSDKKIGSLKNDHKKGDD